mgnify:FL=1
MELSKNIFFNTDKLIQNTTVKISYTGKLFQDQAEEVYLHYGFDNEWKELNEINMEKTDLGFQAEVELPEYESFNFCFRDGNNNWDNNDNQNYIFNIEKNETALAIREEISIDTRKHLRKTYLWSKKIRLAIYKLLVYVPKIISGNYKRKITD